METVASVVAGVAAVGLGLVIGWRVARRNAGDRRRYWILNAQSLFVCVVLSALGGWIEAPWLVVAALSLLLGLLTGLKYGWHNGLPKGSDPDDRST